MVSSSGELIASKVRYCDVAKMDIDLCYETFGSPKNPPILLIMGLNAQMTVWTPEWCDGLVKQGFFVIRFDNRDTGLSSKMDHMGAPSLVELWQPWLNVCSDRYTLHEMALDAFALLDYLKVTKAVVCGTSMGGMIAQTMAILKPERVRALVSIMSTTGGPSMPEPSWPIRLRLALMKPKSTADEDILDYAVKFTKAVLVVGTDFDDEDYIRSRAMLSIRRTKYRAGSGRQIVAIRRAGSREADLRKLQVPTLVVHGDLDYLVPTECGRRMAAMMPRAQLSIVKGMGHYLARSSECTYVLDELQKFMQDRVPN
eukprot:PhM_4_TR6074/c1_g1_i2/m.2707